jgi:hypothetical protein
MAISGCSKKSSFYIGFELHLGFEENGRWRKWEGGDFWFEDKGSQGRQTK